MIVLLVVTIEFLTPPTRALHLGSLLRGVTHCNVCARCRNLDTLRDALLDVEARAALSAPAAAAAVLELEARGGRLGAHASAYQRRSCPRRGDQQGLGQVHEGQLLCRRRTALHENQRDPEARAERAPAGRRGSVPGNSVVQLL